MTSALICVSAAAPVLVASTSSASSARGLNRAGSASSRPCANSGIRHSGGACPATPLSCIIVWMVKRTSRRALVNSSKASGSSTASAETRLVMKPRDP